MNEKVKPLTYHEIRKLRKPLKNINVQHKKNLSILERLAVVITDRVGTMGFFFIIFFWTAIWLNWNIFAPDTWKFDPVPACVFWLFISNMVQIFLMPLIMVGQNLQGRHSEARAEADYEVNKVAEKEIETILMHLENQNELILKILHHLEAAASQFEKKPPQNQA